MIVKFCFSNYIISIKKKVLDLGTKTWNFSFINRGRYGTGTVSWKIFSPRDRVPEFFSSRDSPLKSSPGIPRPRNLSPGPGLRSRILKFWVSVPVPNTRLSDFASQSQIPLILNLSPGFSPEFWNESWSWFRSQISGTRTVGFRELCPGCRPLVINDYLIIIYIKKY